MSGTQEPYPVYGQSEPPRQGMSTGRLLVVGCLSLSGLALLLMIVGTVLVWPRFVKFAIKDELVDLQGDLRSSSLDEASAELLCDRLDVVRDKVDESGMGMLEWIPHSNVFDELTMDGDVDESELPRLDKELQRLEKALNLPVRLLPPAPPKLEVE